MEVHMATNLFHAIIVREHKQILPLTAVCRAQHQHTNKNILYKKLSSLNIRKCTVHYDIKRLHESRAISRGESRNAAVNFDTYRILQYVERLCTLNSATLLTQMHLAPTPWITFRGHSRSRILGSLQSRRGTAYYGIIMWALESEISKERSEHLRFREPHCHLASPI